MGKTLAAYFSAGGQTAKPAQTIADVTPGALFEIKPEVLYTTDKKSRSGSKRHRV